MKFTIQSADLLKAMGPMMKIIPGNSNIEIITYILMTVKDGVLTLTATDMESTIKTKISCIESEDCEIAVNARKLNELLKTMPETVLAFKKKDKCISISWDTGESTLPDMETDEFPPTSECIGTTMAIHPDELNDALNEAIPAIENNELRPIMSGLHFDYGKNSVNIVGASAHMLMITTKMVNNTGEDGNFTLRQKPLSVLRTLSEKTEQDIIITTDGKKAQFTVGNSSLQILLLDGKYPAYMSVIPTTTTTEIVVDKDLLISTLRRVSICSDELKPKVEMDIKNGSINISAKDLQKGTNSHETIACSQMTGEDLEVLFNPRFLIAMLTPFPDEEISIRFCGNNKATTLQATNDDIKMKAIVLPVKPHTT